MFGYKFTPDPCYIRVRLNLTNYVYALTSFGAKVTAIKASSLHWRQKQNNNSSRSAQNHDKIVDKSKKNNISQL